MLAELGEWSTFTLRIYEIFKDRTTIVIAHLLSTINLEDRIVFMDSGKVGEQGTHKELLEMNGQHARYLKLQFSTPHGALKE